MEKAFKVYGYRWVVLFLFILVNIMMQVHWLFISIITNDVKEIYGVSGPYIDLISVMFMLVYLVVSFPASYIIDKWGIRIGVGIGAALLGIFGLVKGFYPESFTMLLISQIFIAVGQPFLLNAITKVAVVWFPLEERATAGGLATMAQIGGMMIAMALTPPLFKACGLATLVMTYGVASAISAVLFIIFCKDHPPTPPCLEGHDERLAVSSGLRHIFKQRDFILLLIAYFFGLGVFNALLTWVGQILPPRGFSTMQAGIAGSVLLLAGIVGAIVIPGFSDKLRKRKMLIVIATSGGIFGLCGFTFAEGYGLLIAMCVLLGFFFIGGGPVNFQYGAEVTYPAPEASSQGLLMLAGQISGILFILVPDFVLQMDDKQPMLVFFIGILVLVLILNLMFRESRHIVTGDI
ncbi:MAG: MFS transporter [Deltaproteobacteria bacterium]|nr:MFS transporter [Deltaproteobacteria bacterium]